MSIQEKLTLLEETLEMDEGTLKLDMNLADIPEYDSMAKLSVIVMMDDEFGVKITGDDIKGFATVEDIINRME